MEDYRGNQLDGSTPRQRASDAEAAPSRSPGAGVLGRMRENAGLALIRPVEASTLVGGACPTGVMSIDAWRSGTSIARAAECAVSFLLV